MIEGQSLVECDITVPAAPFDALPEDLSTDELTARARGFTLHEVGHCLGLGHSAADPMWRAWQDAPTAWPPGFAGDPPAGVRTFFPNPKMSYWNSYGYPGLAPDDVAGISLLYPAAGFLAGVGTVRGRITLADETPVPFVVVSSVESGAPGSPFGSHTFTDAHGRFVLEGLRPGRTMLWVRPYLVPSAHFFSSLEAGWSDVHHTMIWSTVEAGRTLDIGEIRVTQDQGDTP